MMKTVEHYEFNSLPFLASINPLLISNVLDVVMINLPGQDLKKCKSVCGQWRHQASKILKRRSSIVLRSNPCNAALVGEYLDKIESNQLIGVGSLDLVGLRIKEDEFNWQLLEKCKNTLEKLCLCCCTAHVDSLVKALNTTALNVRVLHLRSVGITNAVKNGAEIYEIGTADEVHDINYMLSNVYLPRLEGLVITENIPEDYSAVTLIARPEHVNLSYDLTKIMLAFPNLKSLHLRCNVRPPMDTGSGLMPIPLHVISKCNWQETLKSIKIEPKNILDSKLDMRVFPVLASMTSNVRLMDLDPWKGKRFTVNNGNRSLDLINKFIDKNKNAITKLKVKVKPQDCYRQRTLLPKYIPNLRILQITDNLIGSFDHLRHYKHLKHVEIEEIDVGCPLEILLTASNLEVHPSVESLKVIHFRKIKVEKFARLFPNLKVLDLSMKMKNNQYVELDRWYVKKVTQDFPNLEKLCMKFQRKPEAFSDEDLIGIDMQKLRHLNLYPMDNIHDVAIVNGIGHLDKLENLNLSRTQVTSIGLTKIVNGLPNLKELKLERCQRVTDVDVKKLRDEMKKVEFIFNLSDNEAGFCHRFQRVPDIDHCERICNCNESTEVITN